MHKAKFSSPLTKITDRKTEILGTEPACPLIYLTEASLCTCQLINQCVGGPTQKLLSKSRLFTSPDDHNTLMVAAGDESSSSVSYIDITQTNSLSYVFYNTIDSFKHLFLLTFLRKLHKDNPTKTKTHCATILSFLWSALLSNIALDH